MLGMLLHNGLALCTQVSSPLLTGMPRPPMLPLPHPGQVIAESQPGVGNEPRPFYDFLESCLRHKSEVVIFEAARAICNMRDVTSRELSPAVTVLQLFLSSSKPVLRFAAVRTLNKVGASSLDMCKA